MNSLSGYRVALPAVSLPAACIECLEAKLHGNAEALEAGQVGHDSSCKSRRRKWETS